MANSATLTIKIVADAAKAAAGLGNASKSVGKFQGAVNKMVPAALATVGAIAGVGTAAVKAASDTQQAMGAVDSVFGSSAGKVKAWSDQAATSVGLSKAAYGDLASTVGASLQNMGLSSAEAATKTNDLISLGADLSATFGGSTSDAVNALSSALRGEADPAEKYGLSLKQADINAKLAEQGLSGLTGEALNTAKAQAVMALAMEQSGGAVGQFARESDTAAGSAQIAQAQFSNAASALGEVLLPVVASITEKLASMAQWMSQNSTIVQIIVGVLGTFAAIILAVAAAMKVATAVQIAFNIAVAANPVVLIITAIIVVIAALVAAVIYMWNNWEGFRTFIINMWNGIKAVMAAVVQWFREAWTNVLNWFKSVWNGMKAVVGAVGNFFKSLWAGITGWFKSVWSSVANFFKAIWNSIKAAFRPVADLFKTIWRGVVLAVQIYFRTWKAIIVGVFNAVRSAVRAVANFFKSAWSGAINAVKSIVRGVKFVFTSVFNAIKRPIDAVKGVIDRVVDAVQNLIGWIGRIKIPDLSALNPFKSTAPQSAAPVPGTAGVALYSSPRVIGGGSSNRVRGVGGGIVINVHGGLDSKDAIARKIEQILTAQDRRRSGVRLARRAA